LHLGAQGFRTYYPRLFRTVRHARKLRTVRASFFPQYLFLVLNLERDRWLSVRSTAGVSDLVCSNDRPIAVRRGVIEGFIERSDEYAVVSSVSELEAGRRVQILSGPLSGLIGKLERLDDNGRVRVLLEIMGASVPVGTEGFRLLPVS
jgi:transcriptional antiterminator RfaH